MGINQIVSGRRDHSLHFPLEASSLKCYSSHRHGHQLVEQPPGLPAKEESSRPLSSRGISSDGSEEGQYQLWAEGGGSPQRRVPDIRTQAGVQGSAPGDGVVRANERGHRQREIIYRHG